MKVLKYDAPEINWDKKITVELSLKELLMMYDAAGYLTYKDMSSLYKTSEVPYTYEEHTTFYDAISAIIENEVDMESLQIV